MVVSVIIAGSLNGEAYARLLLPLPQSQSLYYIQRGLLACNQTMEKPIYYITIDTNTWIYLANGTEPSRLLHYLKEQVDKGCIILLMPRRIITEWDNGSDIEKLNTGNADKEKQGARKFLLDAGDKLKKVKMLLEPEAGNKNSQQYTTKEKQELLQLIEHFQSKEAQFKIIVDEVIKENAELIDGLLHHESTIIIDPSDEVRLKASRYAEEKKAPFINKNSMADGLIVLSFLDYVKSNGIEGAYFVTYNKDDFCDKIGRDKIHPDLKTDFDDTKSVFHTKISAILPLIATSTNKYEQTIAFAQALDFLPSLTELITEEESELIDSIQEDIEIEFCRVCIETNGHSNEVYFSHTPHELFDERAPAGFFNKQQLKLNLSAVKSAFNKPQYFNEIIVGYCNWCGSEHFKCPACDSINPLWEGEYDVRKECDGCGLPFEVTRGSYDDGTESEYQILKNRNECANCGDEYDDDGSGTNICQKCEDEYSYGKDEN